MTVFLRICFICLLSSALVACATTSPHSRKTTMTPGDMSMLMQGKRDFEAGYYRQALHELLPLAADGNAEAEYAVGYMYYYGAGVAQDTDAGYFWISRAADQGFVPAKEALRIIKG